MSDNNLFGKLLYPIKQVNQWIIVTQGGFHSEDLKDFRSYPIDD